MYVALHDPVGNRGTRDLKALALIATPIAILSLIALLERLYQERRLTCALEDPAAP